MKRKTIHFNLEDIANTLGLSYETVKQYSSKKKFNPRSLQSICEMYMKLHSKADKSE